jgi:hypothetical protein
MLTDQLAEIIRTRIHRPEAIAEAAARRERLAMADRARLLERLCTALSRPGVHGVLGTADILEDLLLLGALDGKVVIGSMNRGGLTGTVFEIDDRFTGYDAPAIERTGFDGGKCCCGSTRTTPRPSPPSRPARRRSLQAGNAA